MRTEARDATCRAVSRSMIASSEHALMRMEARDAQGRAVT
jgi:hypothetical protein